MPNVTVPVAVDHHARILERIAQGERIADIAADYERTGPALSMALAKYFATEYADALRNQAEQLMNKRETELEAATDGLSISRGRELLAHARWRLERLHPERWGQMPRTAVQVNADGPTVIRIVSWADQETGAIESETEGNR